MATVNSQDLFSSEAKVNTVNKFRSCEKPARFPGTQVKQHTEQKTNEFELRCQHSQINILLSKATPQPMHPSDV